MLEFHGNEVLKSWYRATEEIGIRLGHLHGLGEGHRKMSLRRVKFCNIWIGTDPTFGARKIRIASATRSLIAERLYQINPTKATFSSLETKRGEFTR